MALSIALGSTDPLTEAADVLVVCVVKAGLSEHPTVQTLDEALDGALLEHAKTAEFEAKPDQVLDVATLGRAKARRLLLVGVGPADELTAARLRSAVAAGVRAANQNARAVVIVLPSADVDLRTVGEGVSMGAYRFAKYFTGDRKPKQELAKVSVYLPLTKNRAGAEARKQLALGAQIGAAVALARDAVNEPPNVVFPETLAQVARDLARTHQLKVKVLDKKGILAAGMNLHYAVGQGSTHEPRFIHLTYTPRRKKVKKLVFVGKGLTFDSGGLCIKPAPGMGEMKSDMAGAAAVLGLMAAVAALKPEIEVHVIVGAAENMPDGSAYRPADVFTSLDGKTVEIVNTDAEGRLVLADALCYAARLRPDLIVDAATLTGAALVALGKTTSAFYATEDALARRLEAAAQQAGESFWRMPLLDELGEQLKSDIADLKHTGDRWGGSITAALFLREFVGKVPWVHCDIAGPALADRAHGIYPKGGTGHAVLTFLHLVEALAR
ncbi:MAG TPA: leucyl aminopeptidase [Polyangiaceae bacterium]|nr:leucyl aminopeptidase [Polyangiaceae bacterium]